MSTSMFDIAPAPSTVPVLNPVTSSTPCDSSMPASAIEAVGWVNAPSSGVTKVMAISSRMPRSWKYESARKQNSSGATGHLIGISTTFTTSRPESKRASFFASAVAPTRS